MRRHFIIGLGLLALASLSQGTLAESPRRQVASQFPEALLDAQYQALLRIPAAIDVQYTSRGMVRQVQGAPNSVGLPSDTGLEIKGVRKLKKGDRAPQILTALSDLLMAKGTEELTVSAIDTLGHQLTVTMTQSLRGIPFVHGGALSIAFDKNSETVILLVSYFVPDRDLPSTPAISARQAIERATSFVESQPDTETKSVEIAPGSSLAYYGGGPNSDKPALVWVVNVGHLTKDDVVAKEILVDAVTGKIISAHRTDKASLSRAVYSANNLLPNSQFYPNGLTYLFGEGTPSSSDVHALTAYQHTQSSYLAWFNTFGKDYLPVGVVVHWGTSPSARYRYVNQKHWLSFGEGNSTLIAPSLDRDTVAHEYGHGVFEELVNVASLVPWDDAPGMDEGFADFSAALVESNLNGHPDVPTASTWQIFPVRLPGQLPVHSLSYPRSANTQARDWYTDRSTPGTEHNISSVLGHSLFLLTHGGNHSRVGGPITVGTTPATIPAITVPGLGFNKTKNILYAAFGNPNVKVYPDFPKLKAAMENSAFILYGVAAKDAVTLAWNAVGVGLNCSAPPSSPGIFQYLNCPFWVVQLISTPGAANYQVEYSTHGNFLDPWLGSDGDSYCEIYSNVIVYARGRACNACGCSGWSNTEIITPWQGECP